MKRSVFVKLTSRSFRLSSTSRRLLSDQVNRAALSIAANPGTPGTDIGTLHFRSIRKLKRVGDHILIRPTFAAIHIKWLMIQVRLR